MPQKGSNYITHTYFPKMLEFLEVLERNPHLTTDQLANALGCSVHMISPKLKQLRELSDRVKQEQEYLAELQEVQLRAEIVLQKRYRR